MSEVEGRWDWRAGAEARLAAAHYPSLRSIMAAGASAARAMRDMEAAMRRVGETMAGALESAFRPQGDQIAAVRRTGALRSSNHFYVRPPAVGFGGPDERSEHGDR